MSTKRSPPKRPVPAKGDPGKARDPRVIDVTESMVIDIRDVVTRKP